MILRRLDFSGMEPEELRQALTRQWLITNGLGGYASGTISGGVAWRYHGLLVAALPSPIGRMVMLNHLSEHVILPDGMRIALSEIETEPRSLPGLAEFRLENLVPVWRYEFSGIMLQKQIVFLHGQNTVHVHYQLEAGGPVALELRPSVCFRPHEQAVNSSSPGDYEIRVEQGRFELMAPKLPVLRMAVQTGKWDFRYSGGDFCEVLYPHEAERGYPARGPLWSPGAFHVELQPQGSCTLLASTESWLTIEALTPAEALRFHHDRQDHLIHSAPKAVTQGPGADLVLAASQFVIRPAGRIQNEARAHAAGDEIRTVIAGYHWFTDWGRDTMISLEGLTLTTGRHTEAGWILRTFAHYMKDGLIPNLFPEGTNQGLYHTADATLWFFHALNRYVQVTGDRDTLRLLLPKLVSSIEAHFEGTLFQIEVDKSDGLLKQGAPGYQLTWMDAKVDDWVVTPRRGKTVELQGLFYNALRLLQGWLAEEGRKTEATKWGTLADKTRESFNRKFWYEAGGFLYDVVEGEQGSDVACRPNQLLSFSLDHPVLEPERWKRVLEVVRQELLTPVGLRTLSRGHPDYKPKYFGNLRTRDAAYHQGTVWAWLIGPFVDAWLKVYPAKKPEAREFLSGLIAHLDQGCIGTVSEIFDAEPPFTPRGCIAQAWSVAEILRCWSKTSADC